MELSTVELILIFFSIGSLLIVLIVAWQFRAIRQIILGFKTGSANSEATPAKTEEQGNSSTDAFIQQEMELEKLRAELKGKTIEMAKLARENDAKADALESIKEYVQTIQKKPGSAPRLTKEILTEIEAVIQNDNATFDLQLDELNKRFYASLKEEFPDLTPNDLRLCAYIKIGMSAKEIANLLNIKPSSVYISRSRLRKKLDLSSTDDLHGFLSAK
jgi:hypothetical protein